MKVPFLDLNIQYEEIREEINQALDEVFKRGDFILGNKVAEFEKEFAKYCGLKYGVGVNSGTDALFLSLKALRIGTGDEVIVPAFTYIASVLAISYTGAKPVFCDIEKDTYNINPELIENKITDNTKAIMVVHLYGHPANMEPILEIAHKYDLKVIEDCAQAHGAVYKPARIDTNDEDEGRRMKDEGRRIGSFGDVGCFSFYPSKNLGAFGDGGMVITDNKEIRDEMFKLRDYGRRDKYHHEIIGYNSRLDTVQAAILKVKLKRLDKWNQMRQKSAKQYDILLKDLQEVVTPVKKENAEHVYHIYGVRIRNGKREGVIKTLKDNDIGVIIHYPIPLHLQEVYRDLGYKKGDFPVSEKVAKEVISLPMFPGMKREQIEYVVKVLKLALSS